MSSAPKEITASRRLRNSGVKMRSIAAVSFTLAFVAAKADRRAGHSDGARVGGHDQHHIAEIDRPAVVVGQVAVVHHLQQDVEHVRVRLFDLVKQQHAMRVLIDADRSACRPDRTDIAGRRANQARNGVLLHIFGHVEAQQFDAEVSANCLATSVLPTPVGPANR